MLRMILSTLVIAITATGCASYNVASLDPLQPEFHPSAQHVEGVAVCYSAMSGTESKRYFNKDLSTVGFQPIQFTVQNGPTKYLEFRPKYINLPSTPADQVAQKCHFNVAGRATTYGVIGLFIWPFLIPAIVDGTGAAKANTQMDYDFAAKELKDQIISPHGIANGVVFVPTERARSNIELRLVDKDTQDSLLFRWVDGKPVAASKEQVDQALDQGGESGGG